MPHTREPRCNHCNTGRRRVKAAPNTIHRMNSKCNPRITSANAEYILLFCTGVVTEISCFAAWALWQMKICGPYPHAAAKSCAGAQNWQLMPGTVRQNFWVTRRNLLCSGPPRLGRAVSATEMECYSTLACNNWSIASFVRPMVRTTGAPE